MAILRLFTVLLVLKLATAVPYLVAVQANVNSPEKSLPLTNGFTFCPASLGPTISVECVDPDASYAVFYVNNAWQRREGVQPFTIAGDVAGKSYVWKYPSGQVTLKCRTNQDEVVVTGKFDCSTDTELEVPKVNPSTPTSTPSPAPVSQVPATLPIDGKYCVLIPATTYTNTKSDDWVLNDDNKSLTFRPGDPFAGSLPPNTAKLVYKFTVPVASTYAITMASRTIDKTEHNDIWITFTDGITLIRVVGGKIVSRRENLTGPLKSYQGQPNRYSRVGLSVDTTEHTFSTANVLKPGVEYTITVGARSTQFQFYGLIAFPCSEVQCWIWGDHFQLGYFRQCFLP